MVQLSQDPWRDRRRLIVNGWEIRRPTTFWCACGCATHWRPVKIRIDAAPVPVYHRRVEA